MSKIIFFLKKTKTKTTSVSRSCWTPSEQMWDGRDEPLKPRWQWSNCFTTVSLLSRLLVQVTDVVLFRGGKNVPGATRPRTAFRSAVKGVWLCELVHHADNIVSTWVCGWMLTLAFQIASNRLSWTSLTTSPIIPNLCLVLYLLLFSKKKKKVKLYILAAGYETAHWKTISNDITVCITVFCCFLCYSILLKDADFQITMFKHCWDLVCCRILV